MKKEPTKNLKEWENLKYLLQVKKQLSNSLELGRDLHLKKQFIFPYQLRTPNLSKIILQVQINQGQIFLNWAALNFPKKKNCT